MKRHVAICFSVTHVVEPLICFKNVVLPLWPELQPRNNTTEVMAACNCSPGDNHLSHVEWYWGNISRYQILLYGKKFNITLTYIFPNY